VSAPSLLGFPVTQGGLAEIHAPYLSLFGEMKIPEKKKERKGKIVRSGMRARHFHFNDEPCSEGTLERRWTCVNGVIGGCLAQTHGICSVMTYIGLPYLDPHCSMRRYGSVEVMKM
jgi:hypothetical protein